MSSKWVDVFLYDKLHAYSVIRAKCSSSWGGPFEKVSNSGSTISNSFFISNGLTFNKSVVQKDIAEFGYNTTIGLAQFHEQVLNRFIPRMNQKGGRPPKEYTGKRGRPSKAKTTKKVIEVAVAKTRGRVVPNRKSPMEMYIDAR